MSLSYIASIHKAMLASLTEGQAERQAPGALVSLSLFFYFFVCLFFISLSVWLAKHYGSLGYSW